MTTQRLQLKSGNHVESHTATTQAMPDDRLLVTLADGRSYIIDSERFNPQPDGTYLLELKAADREWAEPNPQSAAAESTIRT